jgi:hypothetical protein
MPSITGLTQQQVALLDTMWSIEGYDEYMAWKRTQPNPLEIDTLETLILLAEIDEVVDTGGGADVGGLLLRYRG